MMNLIERIPLLIALIVFSVLTVNPRINGWNEASRMALTQSLVEQHSFKIDESTFVNTGDKIFVDGHFYSDKPALPSILASLVYWPLYQLGVALDYNWNLAYYLIILLTVKLLWTLSSLAFLGSLRFTSVSPNLYKPLTYLFAFASLTFSWSATFNNHSMAASSLMIAFFFYLNTSHEGKQSPLILSGLFFGLATAFDVPTGIFLVGFTFLVWQKFHLSKKSLLFISTALIPIGIHLGVNYSIGHTFLPLQIIPEYFEYDGSTWENNAALSGVASNSPRFIGLYGLSTFLGPGGFLWYNPLLFVLIPLLWKNVKRSNPLHRETVVIIFSSLILVSYYLTFSSNYGGWSYSIRWFVPLLPLFFFQFSQIDHVLKHPRGKSLIIILTVISVVISFLGLINPWSNLNLHPIPILANLLQLLGHFS